MAQEVGLALSIAASAILVTLFLRDFLAFIVEKVADITRSASAGWVLVDSGDAGDFGFRSVFAVVVLFRRTNLSKDNLVHAIVEEVVGEVWQGSQVFLRVLQIQNRQLEAGEVLFAAGVGLLVAEFGRPREIHRERITRLDVFAFGAGGFAIEREINLDVVSARDFLRFDNFGLLHAKRIVTFHEEWHGEVGVFEVQAEG